MEGFASSAGHSLFINAETFGPSKHGPLSCTDCHTDVTEIPHKEELQRVDSGTCTTCHGEVAATYWQSIHGQARAQGLTEAATCTSCHGSLHDLKQELDPTSPVYQLNLPRTCGTCHGDPELARRHNIPVANAYQLYMDSIHGRALAKSGLLVAANCSNCHGFHGIRPKDDPASKVYRTNIPSTCGACHAGILADYFEGVHGRAVKAGSVAAPVCVDCHTAHEIAGIRSTGR
jgi:DnaJ-class molecular chaperone